MLEVWIEIRPFLVALCSWLSDQNCSYPSPLVSLVCFPLKYQEPSSIFLPFLGGKLSSVDPSRSIAVFPVTSDDLIIVVINIINSVNTVDTRVVDAVLKTSAFQTQNLRFYVLLSPELNVWLSRFSTKGWFSEYRICWELTCATY